MPVVEAFGSDVSPYEFRGPLHEARSALPHSFGSSFYPKIPPGASIPPTLSIASSLTNISLQHRLLSMVATKCSELHELKLLMDCRVHLHGAPPLRRHYRHSGWKLRNGPADLACLRAVCATQFPIAVDGISASVVGNRPVPERHFRVRTAWKVFRPRRICSSGPEPAYTLEVEGEDPDDHEGGSRACSRCGDLWTSYAMCGAQPWASLGTTIVEM